MRHLGRHLPEGRQMFSICGDGPYPGPLFYADESELLHRHDYQPYGPIKRCVCGAVYTTLGDTMRTSDGPTH